MAPVTETPDNITLTIAEAADPSAVHGALVRALQLGLRVIIAPGGSGDITVSPETAANHALYAIAARAGAVRVVERAIGVRPQDVHISRAQGSDHREWMKAHEEAQRQGGVVVVDP